MRAIIVMESLKDPGLMKEIPGKEICRYPLPLNDGPVEVVEIDIANDDVLAVCILLADSLLPERYFAQLQDSTRMHVIFPSGIALVRRGDQTSEEIAQKIGSIFGIPRSQMRFLEMFENNHPDVADA
jgi:hypothetical protein